MGTKIEWANRPGTTGEVWNPCTGCSHVSPGCEKCYAERLAARFGWTKKPWSAQNAAENVVLHPERLDLPLRWKKPRTVFVNSMSDLFHPQVPDEFIDRVFAVMALTPQHCFLVLTKRPERMAEYCSTDRVYRVQQAMNAAPTLYPRHIQKWPLPNVWLGVSVEDQRRADERIPILIDTPAAIRFLSCEPLLGPIDLSKWLATGRINWVIAGGESG